MAAMKLPVAEVIFRADLYPRLETSATTVQNYAEDLSVQPPIEVNQLHELIDGWHRWTAHKKAEADTIRATVTHTSSDEHLLELAIERNAKHGLQLSQTDKRNMARKIYTATPLHQQGAKKKWLAEKLSVSERTVLEWLSRIDKDNKELRDAEIAQLWLACHTQEEIEQAVGITQQGVSRVLQQTATLRFVVNSSEFRDIEDEEKRLDAIEHQNRSLAEHRIDFEWPLYTVWRQQEKTPGSSHYGNSEVRWVDNLLYRYTQLFDIVVDPFAGGGHGAAPFGRLDLHDQVLKTYGVILVNCAFEPLREDQVQVLARAGQKRRTSLRGRHLKLAVELSHITLREKCVGCFERSDPEQSQLLRQASLPGREAAFRAASRLR
jgi:ParB-like chromosome segregation protein Spo0J